MGLGLDGLIEVDVNENGQLSTDELRKTLDGLYGQDRKAVMVVATAGTPVLGVIDDIDQIGKVCEKHRVWLHVDAEKAGGYLFVGQNHALRSQLNGNERLYLTWILHYL